MVDTQNLVRELLKVPADYSSLFTCTAARATSSPWLFPAPTRHVAGLRFT
jgi:hypothetical protein